MIGNWWRGNLKDSIRSFAADYSRRLKLDMVAEQRSIKDKLDRAVLAGDSGQVNIAKAELASLQVKEHQALVVRARLKRMSCEATNMAQELRAWFASSIEILHPGSQFCVQQCGTEVEQTGILCFSLLTWHYACRDLDDEKEGTLRG